jgi:hypothetical protein
MTGTRKIDDYFLDDCMENHPECIKFVKSRNKMSLFECEFDHSWELLHDSARGVKWR